MWSPNKKKKYIVEKQAMLIAEYLDHGEKP